MLIRLIIFAAVFYMLVIAYGEEFTNTLRKYETNIQNARNVTIIVITPTYKRSERIDIELVLLEKFYLTVPYEIAYFRLSQTLSHIQNLHWIVVEDGNSTVEAIQRLIYRSRIPHVYLAITSPPGIRGIRQGWTQRNLALQYIRENYSPETDAVLYFADDDYSYDVRLFDQYIRNVKRLGVWAVGLVGGANVEAPRVNKNGQIEAWDVMFAPRREFAVDMTGFALHVKEIFRVRNATFRSKCAKKCRSSPESCFLMQFGFRKKDAEPFGYDDSPKDILVWHTKTYKSRRRGPTRGFVVEI